MQHSSYTRGPFDLELGPIEDTALNIRRCLLLYGEEKLLDSKIKFSSPQINPYTLHDHLKEAVDGFIINAKSQHGPKRINLVRADSAEVLAFFETFDSFANFDLTDGSPNSNAPYRLQSSTSGISRGISLEEFPQLVIRHGVSELEEQNGWIAGLLPASVISQDPQRWTAPTEWHLRHITSRNGLVDAMSGAKAAEIVGVTPQNFRKYLASEGSSSRQKMSFSMWHLLLHRLGVQRMRQGTRALSASHATEQGKSEQAQ